MNLTKQLKNAESWWIVVRVWLEREKVEETIMYGLATNYKSEGAIPIILYLDFFKASARVLLSTGPFPILRALNWLLNCVTLK